MAKPYVHWAAFDTPAEVTSLPTAPRLEETEGLLQGHNSYGATDWHGMCWPAGELVGTFKKD